MNTIARDGELFQKETAGGKRVLKLPASCQMLCLLIRSLHILASSGSLTLCLLGGGSKVGRENAAAFGSLHQCSAEHLGRSRESDHAKQYPASVDSLTSICAMSKFRERFI